MEGVWDLESRLHRANGRDVRGVAALGFDVEPGGTFSVVGIDENGRIVVKQESVSLARLIRLVWEFRPRILACDNIFELSEDEDMLRKILSMLPDETEVVQVTRRPDGTFADIRSIAALAGLRVDGKLSPSRTAYLSALLALRGFGSRVIFTEEKTKIVIAANHHGSSGGMSQARYQRGVKASILRATRVIKKLLDKHGFDYDLVFRKSGHGLESAVFIVYAPRSALRGIIRQFRGKSIRIEIRPVYSGRIQFEAPLHEEHTRYLIVGVDPGIVTAVAAIDLRGNPVFIYSRKGLDRAEIIELVKKHGIPVLVATDVTPPPETVKKLAASLGVPLYTPPTSLTIDEKHALVENYVKILGRNRLNAHERDALAAAVRAFREYSSKFRQIEAAAAKYPAEISIENLKASVLKGATIAEAIEAEIERMLTEKPPKPVKRVRHNLERRVHDDNAVEVQRLVEELEAAKARIRVLEERLNSCREEKRELENRIRIIQLEASSKAEEKMVEYQARISTLQEEVERLRKQLAELQDRLANIIGLIASLYAGKATVAVRIPSLSRKSLKMLADDEIYAQTRLLLIESIGGLTEEQAKWVSEVGAKAVFVYTNGIALEALRSQLEEKYQIPVVRIEKENVISLNSRYVIIPYNYVEEATLRRLELELKTRKGKQNGEEQIMTFERLRSLLESYRRARAQELNSEESEVTDIVT